MNRLLLIVLVCLSATCLCARNIDVQAINADQSSVARLQSQVEPAFEHVAKLTGLHDDLDLQLVVVGGAVSFEKTAQADGVGMNAESILGYAIPGRRRLVLNLSAIRERQLEPIGVLRHEIAHLVMGSTLRVERPLWFEEGVAQYVESMAFNELIEAQGATPFDDYPDLADLDTALRTEGRAGAAYAEARAVIRLVVNHYGEKAFFRLLTLMEKGEGPFDAAFEKATGETLAQFEPRWLQNREDRAAARLERYFGSNLTLYLLACTGIAVPIALVFLLWRLKRKAKEWEAPDAEPDDPEWSYADDQYHPTEDPDAWKRRYPPPE